VGLGVPVVMVGFGTNMLCWTFVRSWTIDWLVVWEMGSGVSDVEKETGLGAGVTNW
jgi:hypothetical protein